MSNKWGSQQNRIVDLYARVKKDVWNLKPDYLVILIGINDLWHEIDGNNGVDLERFNKVYSMLIEDTLIRLPNLKIVLLEPFVLSGWATEAKFDKFKEIYEYAKVVKDLCIKYNLDFIPLQEILNDAVKNDSVNSYLYDGIHTNSAGAYLIASEVVKTIIKD